MWYADYDALTGTTGTTSSLNVEHVLALKLPKNWLVILTCR